MDYDDDILRMKYWDVKDLKADRTSLLLDCSIIKQKCPLFPYARPCAPKPPDLLDAVYHHTMRRGATFDVGSLVVENALRIWLNIKRNGCSAASTCRAGSRFAQ